MPYPRLTRCMPDEGRYNPFQRIHKALRCGHCRMLSELGVTDFTADAASQRLQQLADQIALCRAVADARQAALLATPADDNLLAGLTADHAGHLIALAELSSLVRAMNVATPRRRALAGRNVYRCFALYAAADMARMDEDETLLLSALHQLMDDEQLRGVEVAGFAGLAPEQLGALMRLMLPALSTPEIEALLGLLGGHLEDTGLAKAVAAAVEPLRAANSSAAA